MEGKVGKLVDDGASSRKLKISQKIISAIIRTGQKFGVRHIINVLQGKENDASAHLRIGKS